MLETALSGLVNFSSVRAAYCRKHILKTGVQLELDENNGRTIFDPFFVLSRIACLIPHPLTRVSATDECF